MSFPVVLLALLALPVGFGAGRLISRVFPRSRTSETILMLVTLLPWYSFHGRVLNALRFGAVQSQWTYPSAFDWVHGTGYLVAGCTALVAGLATGRARWALVFAPGLTFLGTLFITLPLAEGAVAEGYFILPAPTMIVFWIGTITGTAVLLGYCRQPGAFAPASVPPAALGDDAKDEVP